MPGESMDDALEAARTLPTGVVLTCLGENVHTSEQAEAVAAHYRRLLSRIAEEGVDAELSVKPTHLGLDLGEEICLTGIRSIAEAQPTSVEVRPTLWVDMEDSTYVDRTLELVEALQGGPAPVGVCLQAYLHRTPGDLARICGAGIPIRLVKGAYRELPSVAMAAKKEVDAVYLRMAHELARSAPERGRHVLGTHDEGILNEVFGEQEGSGTLEVQMLFGIARDTQLRLARAGVPLRVLISYGEHWFPWYMRRLAERPANLGFLIRSLVRG